MYNQYNSSYFITNDLGGGGTNVSRFICYLSLLDNSLTNLLLTYYYLNTNFKKPVSFDVKDLKKINKYNNIGEFIKELGKTFALNRGKISSSYKYKRAEWQPIVLLDSGSGNILRDISSLLKDKSNKSYQEIYKKIIKEYHDFAESLNFDISIAFDLALKYTYKNKESTNKIYQTIVKTFKNDLERNRLLLEITLEIINSKHYNQKIFAPLHGASIESFSNYLNQVLLIESEYKRKFDGFAIGGVANTNKMSSSIWNVPDNVSRSAKSSVIIGSIVKTLRLILNKRKDNRPIHVLGAGAIKNVISLLYTRAKSFDCHTPWRRASDGNNESVLFLRENKTSDDAKWSKFLVPLLNSRLEVLNNKLTFYYRPIVDLDSNLDCDCEICKNYSMSKIKELYSGSQEDNYFAKILIFFHAIWQYEFLIKKIKMCNDEKKLFDFVNSIPDKNLRDDTILSLNFLRGLK